jgi:hypothetical protein
MRRIRSSVLLAIVSLFGFGCDDTCVIPPCAAPVAIVLSVSSPSAPTGIPALTVTVTVAGSPPQTIPCQVAAITQCHIPGAANTYQLQLNAPGYVPVNLAVIVTATQPACSCVIVDTQQLTVLMQPAAT